MTVTVAAYEGGYRPTALGQVTDRPFYFRMDGQGAWELGVGHPGTSLDGWAAWLCEEGELEYVTDGQADGPTWQEDSLPWLLVGLERYLRAAGVSDPGELLDQARAAAARFAPG